ncbi:MAG: hypothetical protein AAF436_05090 [Myxococcota bacterium]
MYRETLQGSLRLRARFALHAERIYLSLKLGCLTFVSGYLFATTFVGVLALAGAYPLHPITPLGWALWFVLALPVTVLLEGVGQTVFGERLGRKIDGARGISAKRILVALAFSLVAFALGTLVVVSVGAVGGGFWGTHFSDNW